MEDEDQRLAMEEFYEGRFLEELNRYLQGIGHPQHPSLEGFVYPPDVVLSESSPSILRSNLFLLAISGFALLPPFGERLHVGS